MSEFKFADSAFKFTNPVRYFKANDPYYWEVDNIPVKQLEENTLWLKDQIVKGIDIQGVKRADFDELRPYVNGGNNKVKVMPGRFIGRVNDAYNKNFLQKLILTEGSGLGQIDGYKSDLTAAEFDDILDKFKSEVATDALYLNGLETFKVSWGNKDENHAPDSTDFSTGFKAFPLEPLVFKENLKTNTAQIFKNSGNTHVNFARMWRGIARTAVVDVPDELQIGIPAFKEGQFQYIDSNGVKQTMTNAEVRIDLLFLYTHPVDTSSTAILKDIDYQANSVQTITTPTLGILVGAGAMLNLQKNDKGNNEITGSKNPNGALRMLASVADQKNTNAGFTGSSIHGSFPAPDDLLNIAPNLVVGLEETNLQLVGQSILPLAYIVVRKTAAVNTAGKIKLTEADLIDIRPFFRTAELAYNERAGIAAAVPSLSLANPAVGEAQLDYKVQQLKGYVDDLVGGEGDVLNPKVVAAGMIWGGKSFGVEGTLVNAQDQTGINYLDLLQLDETIVPDLPDWDIAPWAQSKSDSGTKRNDRIFWNNYEQKFTGGYSYGAGGLKKLGTENKDGKPLPATIYYCRKTIFFDTQQVGWMKDYDVEVQLQNCVPQTNRASVGSTGSVASPAGTWVERYDDHFVINVAWIADDSAYNLPGDDDKQEIHGKLPVNDRDTYGFSGFHVQSSEFQLNTNSSNPKSGVATYPTVTFKMTGYPANWSGFYANLNQDSPVIKLV